MMPFNASPPRCVFPFPYLSVRLSVCVFVCLPLHRTWIWRSSSLCHRALVAHIFVTRPDLAKAACYTSHVDYKDIQAMYFTVCFCGCMFVSFSTKTCPCLCLFVLLFSKLVDPRVHEFVGPLVSWCIGSLVPAFVGTWAHQSLWVHYLLYQSGLMAR